MPGVPTGRGCDGCRRQKKKCDLGSPCSRCARLKIQCVGSGQRRFKFQAHYDNNQVQEPSPSTSASPTSNGEAMRQVILHVPSNETSRQISSYVKTVGWTVDVRFNLSWTYGLFLQDLPRRLGGNLALDAAVDSLMAAHSDICMDRKAGTEAIRKYGAALKTLRLYLGDEKKARESETLAAIMVLMISMGFIGGGKSPWSGHGQGAAQLLKLRGFHDPNNDFEAKLVGALRGPVVTEGLFNPNIKFTPYEWTKLVENHLDKGFAEGRMIHCLARVPQLLRRGRALVEGYAIDPGLADEVESVFEEAKQVAEDVQDGLQEHEKKRALAGTDFLPLIDSHAHYQRVYALAIGFAILPGCLLTVLKPKNASIPAQLDRFAREIISVAKTATQYRPLGSSYVALCLLCAAAGSDDPGLRVEMEKQMAFYSLGDAEDMGRSALARVDFMWRHFRLMTTETEQQQFVF